MKVWDQAVETVRKCLRHGIDEFILCGGARNAALVEVLARAESAGRVTLRRHFEERSAGFFALGRCQALDESCAVVTTSGTAVAELLPAMVEAHAQGRPLVAITADRPAAYRGTGAPQTIEQPGIFGPYAGCGPLDQWDRRSPWHWNVELEEEFEPGEVGFDGLEVLPVGREPAPSVARLAQWLGGDPHLGLVLAIGGLEPEDREEACHFALGLNVPVVAEATSGLREVLEPLSLADPDRILGEHPPGKLLRLGELPSGRFWRDLEGGSTEVWNVCRTGKPGLARSCETMQGSVGRVLRALGAPPELDDALDLLPRSGRSRARIEELLEAYPESEPGLLRTLSHYAALGDGLFLGNSLPIREWNLFAQFDRPVPEVRANRGANGIDGQLSTWLGWSAWQEGAWGIFGDLTALYDLAAPAMLGQVRRAGRVLVVVNNRGGGIFDRVPRLRKLGPRSRELLVNPQEVRLEAWAEMWGMRHLPITCGQDFDALEPGEETLLVELRPDARETERFWERW